MIEAYPCGTEVLIHHDREQLGFIESIIISDGTLRYKVVWMASGTRHSARLHPNEIEPYDDTDKTSIGYKQTP